MTILDEYRARFSLSGKVVLVTGGSGGIGACVCQAAAAAGANVFVSGRNQMKLDALCEELAQLGCEVDAMAADATDRTSIASVVGAAMSRYNYIDVLINCVGTHIDAPAAELAEEDWHRVLDVNLTSALLQSQEVAKCQIGVRSGKHIHVSSVRGSLGIRRGYAAYCASKGGLNMLIKQLASEWGQHSITVNGVAPTYTRTDLVKSYLEDETFYSALVARIPLARVCEPEEVAAAAVYLASPAADFITGQILALDGGITACQ